MTKAELITAIVTENGVVGPVDEPTAITTLTPPAGLDVQAVRDRLIRERGIVSTVAEVMRAPFEMTGPVLRVSPHVDVTAVDLETFAAALEEVGAVRRHRCDPRHFGEPCSDPDEEWR